jgi:hypothetical protein
MVDKVELHRRVLWYLKYRCTPAEQDAFWDGLKRVVADPIRHSEHQSDPRLSRYMLRIFRFGGCLAVFEHDAAAERIRVLECRRVRSGPPEREGEERPGSGPAGKP